MALDTVSVMEAAQSAIATQDAELAAVRARQPLLVICRTASGGGDLDESFALDRPFRLVFLRCHFAGAAGRNPLTLALDSAAGAAFDVRLFTVTRAGVGADVNLRISAAESAEPSPWTFQTGDALRVQWTNPSPGSLTWGLEVGMAVAS